jgi:hypothetical protein
LVFANQVLVAAVGADWVELHAVLSRDVSADASTLARLL